MPKNAARDAEIAEIDAMLSEPKRLHREVPEWSENVRKNGFDASWTVEDLNGVARAQLRFRCRRSALPNPVMVLMYRSRQVWKIELEYPARVHRNPHWVGRLGLPAVVCGSHQHTWADNRDHLAEVAPDWDLPARRPSAGIAATSLPHALAEFATHIRLTIESAQLFDVPPQHELLV